MPEVILYSFVFVVTYLGVRYFRFWSLKKNLLDVPNERSSHTMPTPRGGGLIIVLTSLFAYVFYNKITGRDFSGSFVLGAFIIALVSWLDDLFSISFVWRFLVHSIAAILFISATGYFTEIYIPFGGIFDLRFFGSILTFVWIVWLTNAFNFMDGIDGLAGMQAVTAGIGWLIIGKISGFDGASVLGGVLAISSLGFLLQNWQPARIFMGDVGSAFLGFSFAVLPLLAKSEFAEHNFTPPIGMAVVTSLLLISAILLTNSIASKTGTPTISQLKAFFNPNPTAIPIRTPVKLPGPLDTTIFFILFFPNSFLSKIVFMFSKISCEFEISFVPIW